jgi:hypothetical protein
MLTKLDRKTMEGTAMQALHEAFDDKLGAQIKPFDLIDHFRLQIFFYARHGPSRPWKAGLQVLQEPTTSTARRP